MMAGVFAEMAEEERKELERYKTDLEREKVEKLQKMREAEDEVKKRKDAAQADLSKMNRLD
jgi:hypothetical protein